jgi:hypothetical protein
MDAAVAGRDGAAVADAAARAAEDLEMVKQNAVRRLRYDYAAIADPARESGRVIDLDACLMCRDCAAVADAAAGVPAAKQYDAVDVDALAERRRQLTVVNDATEERGA